MRIILDGAIIANRDLNASLLRAVIFVVLKLRGVFCRNPCNPWPRITRVPRYCCCFAIHREGLQRLAGEPGALQLRLIAPSRYPFVDQHALDEPHLSPIPGAVINMRVDFPFEMDLRNWSTNSQNRASNR